MRNKSYHIYLWLFFLVCSITMRVDGNEISNNILSDNLSNDALDSEIQLLKAETYVFTASKI